jgi:transcriptional repressor NrdR
VVCPFCEHGDTKVVDKRESDATSTRRRRECLGCHQRFTTYERVEPMDLVVVKHDGRKETFSIDKLRKGVALAIAKRPVTDEQVEQILEETEVELRGTRAREVPSHLIGKLVMEKLKLVDHVAYIRFASVCRDFNDATSFQDEVKDLLHAPSQTS